MLRFRLRPGLRFHIWDGIPCIFRIMADCFRESRTTYVYFVHSYYLQAEEPEIVKATTEYSTCIHASVEKDNVFACQFHPEKSSKWGLKILENFAAVGKDGNTEKEGK